MSIITQPLENVRRQLRLFVFRLGAALFAAPDAQARRNGWIITPRWGGLARTYRHERFARFRQCGACLGSGFAGTACAPCGGTGRVTVAHDRERAGGRAS
jgi:hypothetical protein